MKGDNHGKTLECLLALRKGCMLEQVGLISLLDALVYKLG
jgi:hypothetical protein